MIARDSRVAGIALAPPLPAPVWGDSILEARRGTSGLSCMKAAHARCPVFSAVAGACRWPVGKVRSRTVHWFN